MRFNNKGSSCVYSVLQSLICLLIYCIGVFSPNHWHFLRRTSERFWKRKQGLTSSHKCRTNFSTDLTRYWPLSYIPVFITMQNRFSLNIQVSSDVNSYLKHSFLFLICVIWGSQQMEAPARKVRKSLVLDNWDKDCLNVQLFPQQQINNNAAVRPLSYSTS